MSFAVIPQQLSISAMRSSGYRNTAQALAELIDNSIQSGEDRKEPVQVEIICIERSPDDGGRPQLHAIAVLDDASGMTGPILRTALQFGNGTRLAPAKHTGIGKFGMGLPNSSISQCKRVDVWTWKDTSALHCHLDVDQIEKGTLIEVPLPEPDTVPSDWLRLFMNGMGRSGTLVVWNRLDRVTWKQGTTLLRHVEFLAGRIYRRFIRDKRVVIRLAAYEDIKGSFVSKWESFVRPNDPLYLSTGSSAPAPYDQRPAFDAFGREVRIGVAYGGREHDITIRSSIAKAELRIPGGGARPIGKHAARNQGVSVMRAGRELELNRSFEVADFRERWWGIEVDFPPALDDLFGVTNNKQSATAFGRMSLDEDAEAEDMRPADYQRLLEKEGDPRLPMYAISNEVDKLIRQMRTLVAKMSEAQRVAAKADTLSRRIEIAATALVKKRRERVGSTGLSDRQEEQPVADRTNSLVEGFVGDGIEPASARAMAVEYVTKRTKFQVRHAPLPGSSMFDVTATGGVIVVTFNTRHVVHPKVFASFQQTDEATPLAREVLSLVIAWARMEDEAGSPQIRNGLEETRESWGRMARDFFEPDEG